ncbi:hypothetical protein [Endozoicomonas sp. SESOKO3]|uniref:hypothetical protein n=1 Tax=Endozoicomonas sp. SESOKO3 TaxID=2828744 RepID=UPI002148E7A8|nr:hypothetical protein [Endozoicomonas sp. SESOKO3]
MLLLSSLSVACRAQTLTERYVVEFEKNGVSPNQRFFRKRERHILSDNPSDIIDTNGYTGSVSVSDTKRQKPYGYTLKTTIIKSISWQWLYATQLLVGFELTLTIRDSHLNSGPYSWIPAEVVVAVGWLLKSYWSFYFPLLNPIEQQEASITTQGEQLFAAITMVLGSGHNQTPYQSSKSSEQQAQQAPSHLTGSFISLLNSDAGDGDRGSQQHKHTLGLNCFVHPCNGVCNLRQSSDRKRDTESLFEQSDTLIATSGTKTEIETTQPGAIPIQSSCTDLKNENCLSCISHFEPDKATHSPDISLFVPSNELQFSFRSDPLFEPKSCTINDDPGKSGIYRDGVALDGVALDGVGSNPLSTEAANITDTVWPLNEDEPMSGNWPSIANDFADISGSLDSRCLLEKAAFILTLNHSETQHTTTQSSLSSQSQPSLSLTAAMQVSNNSGQLTCDYTVVGEHGQPQLCEKVCKSAKALSDDKSGVHTTSKTCDLKVHGENGQPRPCGMVFKNTQLLSNHKRKDHTGPRICDVIVIGKDGNPQRCGAVCKNVSALSSHKSGRHTGQRTCNMIVVGEDGIAQPCGRIYKNAQLLSAHKSGYHTGKKTCNLTVVGEDDQQRPCGTVCKNAQSLSAHKTQIHTGPKICDVTIVGENGHQRSCGKFCENLRVLVNHKRTHRKRKPDDVDQNRALRFLKNKKNK